MLPSLPPAILALADGTIFQGISIGAHGWRSGEVVFNTALTGYQEILTDPSYAGQIITLTYPHIGNVGVNVQDIEAGYIHAAGLIIKDLPALASNFRMQRSLHEYLLATNTVALAGIDTRKLTRILREKGTQPGCLLASAKQTNNLDPLIQQALKHARACPGLSGVDLAKVVSTPFSYSWEETAWQPHQGYSKLHIPQYHVVVFDLGVKRNILRMLAQRNCRVTVLPAHSNAEEALSLRPDGILFSNGPGDPEACDYAVTTARKIIEAAIPTFGICLGHQIMALAAGARTTKMKFGHHGANHPVKDLDSGKVIITSQNHNFAVDLTSLPNTVRTTHVSLFDGSLQGLAWNHVPAFSFQGHPEASPGPHDLAYLFDHFVGLMSKHSQKLNFRQPAHQLQES